MDTKTKTNQKLSRKRRVRSKIFGTASRPRLSVHRSNTKLTAQLVNDELGKTVCAATSAGCKGKTPLERSESLGEKIAELAKKNKIASIVFDRGSLAYKGNIKALAEAARKAGLKF